MKTVKTYKLLRFSTIFLILLALEIIVLNKPELQDLRYITKPSLLSSLLIFFYFRSKHLESISRKLGMTALFFMLLGDILLMFVPNSENYFIAGLLAFLIGNSFYIALFFQRKTIRLKKFLLFIAFLLTYALTILFIIHDSLGSFFLPVVVYMIVMLNMAKAAFLRCIEVNTASYYLVLIGVILFLVSDTILAIDKFHETIPYAGTLIMLTYGLGQWGITLGVVKQAALKKG